MLESSLRSGWNLLLPKKSLFSNKKAKKKKFAEIGFIMKIPNPYNT